MIYRQYITLEESHKFFPMTNEIYKEFNDYQNDDQNDSDNDNAYLNIIQVMGNSLEQYEKSLSNDDIIAILISFCKIYAERQHLTIKEQRRALKSIIDKVYSEQD